MKSHANMMIMATAESINWDVAIELWSHMPLTSRNGEIINGEGRLVVLEPCIAAPKIGSSFVLELFMHYILL